MSNQQNRKNFLLEPDGSCYISIDHKMVTIHLEAPEGFLRFVQSLWVYKPFEHEKIRNALQYYSHLIMDGETRMVAGEMRTKRHCPNVDFFLIEGVKV